MQLLIFNAGSSSLKFDLLEAPARGPARRHLSGAFDAATDGSGLFAPHFGAAGDQGLGPVRSLGEAANVILDWLGNASLHGRDLLAGVAATVHRIVHGGEMFRATTLLGDAELAKLSELSVLAPLHNPPALAVIAAVRGKIGPERPVIGVFDTAYYADLPEAAYRYAVPARWYREFRVRRYGFHGTAHRYLCVMACRRLQRPPDTTRVVSLQLGRGCSVTATLAGRAVATSMGFTPLEGLVMGTRSGDVDPGAVLFVMARAGLSPVQIGRELNQESGLLGLSGRTADMRELLALEQSGDRDALLAVEGFCRQARHYVAAYIAELGGVDVIAFGGGIGENCPEIRRRILHGLQWAGIELDAAANSAALGLEASINAASSRAAIQVIPVDEASVMASEAASLLSRETPRR
jgi:acetate kinase